MSKSAEVLAKIIRACLSPGPFFRVFTFIYFRKLQYLIHARTAARTLFQTQFDKRCIKRMIIIPYCNLVDVLVDATIVAKRYFGASIRVIRFQVHAAKLRNEDSFHKSNARINCKQLFPNPSVAAGCMKDKKRQASSQLDNEETKQFRK